MTAFSLGVAATVLATLVGFVALFEFDLWLRRRRIERRRQARRGYLP